MTNLDRVHALYLAFSQGNIPAILSALSPDCSWSSDGPPSLPFFGTRRGHAQITDFFHHIASHLKIHEFSPQQFITQGDTIIVLGFERGQSAKTQKPYTAHWAHAFHFQNSQITAFREYIDSASITAACSLS